jgi:hypothetical protein
MRSRGETMSCRTASCAEGGHFVAGIPGRGDSTSFARPLVGIFVLRWLGDAGAELGEEF